MFPSSIVVDGGNLLVQPELRVREINQSFSANCSRSHRIVTDPVPREQLHLREFLHLKHPYTCLFSEPDSQFWGDP